VWKVHAHEIMDIKEIVVIAVQSIIELEEEIDQRLGRKVSSGA